MNEFQVDECANWRRFAEECARQGLVRVRRFPKKLKEAKDQPVLGYVLPSDRTLLTTDRKIHFEHASVIPDRHSGILIVACESPAATMTERRAKRILEAFKSSFPEWHVTSVRNSVVEITEAGVQVWRMADSQVHAVDYLDFRQQGWQERLRTILVASAESNPAPRAVKDAPKPPAGALPPISVD